MCARYAFRKRTAQRVEVLGVPSGRPSNRTTTEPRPGHGAQCATTPRPPDHACMLPPRASPRRHSTAQHEMGSGACTPVWWWWWWWWRALSCRSFPRLHRSRERPRPAFRKGAHNARTGRALGKRRAQTPAGALKRQRWVGVGWVTTSAA
jgi:hypothetical protein